VGAGDRPQTRGKDPIFGKRGGRRGTSSGKKRKNLEYGDDRFFRLIRAMK